jgi:hypothetical protein
VRRWGNRCAGDHIAVAIPNLPQHG